MWCPIKLLSRWQTPQASKSKCECSSAQEEQQRPGRHGHTSGCRSHISQLSLLRICGSSSVLLNSYTVCRKYVYFCSLGLAVETPAQSTCFLCGVPGTLICTRVTVPCLCTSPLAHWRELGRSMGWGAAVLEHGIHKSSCSFSSLFLTHNSHTMPRERVMPGMYANAVPLGAYGSPYARPLLSGQQQIPKLLSSKWVLLPTAHRLENIAASFWSVALVQIKSGVRRLSSSAMCCSSCMELLWWDGLKCNYVPGNGISFWILGPVFKCNRKNSPLSAKGSQLSECILYVAESQRHHHQLSKSLVFVSEENKRRMLAIGNNSCTRHGGRWEEIVGLTGAVVGAEIPNSWNSSFIVLYWLLLPVVGVAAPGKEVIGGKSGGQGCHCSWLDEQMAHWKL